ncbi:carotenoid oxygenase [Rhodocollybia butyracea]|uniref:Carotenoid oxygenase n=1 Tax=Rhodocollybia butyracea TaxID=206335 RepID=A0A9P5PXC6_9AGAR|nr:carotenoid oxygenase [Rhodocollybia butyracea]
MHSSAAGFETAPEQRVPVDLTIHGTIPPWLTGVLYRTGPGTYRIPSSTNPSQSVDIQHWFDGLGMNHRFEIHPGGTRVSYSSRKSCDDYERQTSEQGKLPAITFGQQPDICQTIFRKFFTTFHQAIYRPKWSNTPSGVNVSVTLSPEMPGWDKLLPPELKQHEHSGPQYLVAKTDADALQLIDPVSLEPLVSTTYKKLDPRLDGELSAAHSCWDKETNEFYNYSCRLGPQPTYKVFRIRGNSSVDIVAEIKDAPLSYLHSFAMTSKYVILVIWQAHITNFGLSILYHQNIAQAIGKWNPNLNSLFYVIDKKNGEVVAKYQTPPFFCFHQINAFDDPEKDDIIIDMSVYEDHSIIEHLYLDKLRTLSADTTMHMGRLRRFCLPSVTSPLSKSKTRQAHVEFTLPRSESIELATINPGNYQRTYRYTYGVNSSSPDIGRFADHIIKLDMQNINGGHKLWGIAGYTPSEPIFVPRPGAETEDDGVVLTVVLDGIRGKSMLVILNAQDMTECARAEMETVFPIGFHGVWTQKNTR